MLRHMKRIALIVVLFGLIGCAANNEPSSLSTVVPIEKTAAASPTPRRSVELTPTSTVAIQPTRTSIATQPVATATSIAPTPTSAPTAQPQPTGRSAVPDCPPPPTPVETKTQAAVQRFEHGLMFWLQAREEIWTLIDSPLNDQFYWRVLPNLWSESQPESDPNLQPPADRFQPVRGFGLAWRLGGGSFGPQRDDLGWAIDQEVGFDTTLIYYPQGYYSPDCTWMPKSGIYELRAPAGTVYQFIGAGGIAKIVTQNP